MSYQQERARQLEELHKRFPGGNALAQQVVDAKESGANIFHCKPRSSQIIMTSMPLKRCSPVCSAV